MKAVKILFLVLFLAISSLSEELMLHENEGKTGSAFCLKCNHRTKTECVPVKEIKIFVGRYECIAGKTVRKKEC
ncbi:MAG: hypothetical protein LBH25_14725 [Fibromonadaceae bacterium]|jgi:hypothetical protein|nr:hypothetical protein [Fibromonadaceae bacterium]